MSFKSRYLGREILAKMARDPKYPDFSGLESEPNLSVATSKEEPNLVRPAHDRTAYVLIEANTGPIPVDELSGPDNCAPRCGAACRNCYLIYGGERPTRRPEVDELLGVRGRLTKDGYRPIFTGADLLTLSEEYWNVGLFDEQPYLLTSGYPIVLNPQVAMRRIVGAGMTGINMSLHGAGGTENVFNGAPIEVVRQAVGVIRTFNDRFGTKIGVVGNVTVHNENVDYLEDIATHAFEVIGVDALRLNRHKVRKGHSMAPLMLPPTRHHEFYGRVRAIRARYPKGTKTFKPINVSGDFGNYGRPINPNKGPYECGAGSNSITLVPGRDGIYSIFPCLELRGRESRIGTLTNEGLNIDQEMIEKLTSHNTDACFAFAQYTTERI